MITENGRNSRNPWLKMKNWIWNKENRIDGSRINRACVAVAMSAIFTRRFVTAQTNRICPGFPFTRRLVAALRSSHYWCLWCGIFITHFPHLSQRWLQYWWLWHGVFIIHFPHLMFPHLPQEIPIAMRALLSTASNRRRCEAGAPPQRGEQYSIKLQMKALWVFKS